MKFTVSESIDASAEKVWSFISDIENCAGFISGIEKVEVIEKPDTGLLGFKWKETRTLFGKTAEETMWITDVQDGQSYQARAENHGAIYISKLSVQESDGQSILTMHFDGTPVSFGAKIMSALMGWMFKGATAKAMRQDLIDIKKVAEEG